MANNDKGNNSIQRLVHIRIQTVYKGDLSKKEMANTFELSLHNEVVGLGFTGCTQWLSTSNTNTFMIILTSKQTVPFESIRKKTLIHCCTTYSVCTLYVHSTFTGWIYVIPNL